MTLTDRTGWWTACFIAAAFACSESPVNPNPGECQSTLDCGLQEVCREGACEFVACVGDASCGDPRFRCGEDGICALQEGLADECDAERPCDFGQFCSTLLGRCFETSDSRACARRSECPEGQTCDREAAQCVPDVGCFGPEFCDPDELCNPISQRCEVDDRVFCERCTESADCGGGTCNMEQLACTVDGESPCAEGTFCGNIGQCVQCQVNADCGSGLVCNTSRGRCESNLRCADSLNQCPSTPGVQCVVCEAPLTCNFQLNRCEAPPPPCDDDTDCAENARCDQTQDPPVCVLRPAQCLDDVFDDAGNNGSVAMRSSIDPVVPGMPKTVEDLIVCPGDEDWYGVDVPAGTEVTIDLRFQQADGDLELQVFLEDGTTLLAEGRSVTDNERVRFAVGTPRNLAIRVVQDTPTPAPVPYRLRVTFDPAPPCEDDAFEPNDARDQAQPLPTFETVSAQLCPADPDWYRIDDIPPGSSVDLSLDFVPGRGDLRLDVFRPGEPTALLTSDSRNDVEFLRVPAAFGGTLLIRVSGRRTDSNPYGLRAEVFADPTATCPDDPGEPNDSPTTSSTIGEVLNQQFALCQGDEDWYEIEFPGSGGVLAVELEHGPEVDLDAIVYVDGPDPLSSAGVAAGQRPGRREYFTYSSFVPETLLLRVFGATDSDLGPYTLRTLVESSFICMPDEADEAGLGNTFETAYDIGTAPLRSVQFTQCAPPPAGDPDFLRFTLPPGFLHEVRLQWRRQNIQMGFGLQDENGTPLSVPVLRVDNSVSFDRRVTDSPEVLVISPNTGMVPLPTDYILVIDSKPILACEGDRFDENAPVLLMPPVSESGLELCPTVRDPMTQLGDTDLYALPDLSPGERLEAQIRFGAGDLSLELLQIGVDEAVRPCEPLPPEGQRCFSDGFSDTERVGYTATATVTDLFLRVSSVYSAFGVTTPDGVDTNYTLDVEVLQP